MKQLNNPDFDRQMEEDDVVDSPTFYSIDLSQVDSKSASAKIASNFPTFEQFAEECSNGKPDTLLKPMKKLYRQDVPLGTWNGKSIFKQ